MFVCCFCCCCCTIRFDRVHVVETSKDLGAVSYKFWYLHHTVIEVWYFSFKHWLFYSLLLWRCEWIWPYLVFSTEADIGYVQQCLIMLRGNWLFFLDWFSILLLKNVYLCLILKLMLWVQTVLFNMYLLCCSTNNLM